MCVGGRGENSKKIHHHTIKLEKFQNDYSRQRWSARTRRVVSDGSFVFSYFNLVPINVLGSLMVVGRLPCRMETLIQCGDFEDASFGSLQICWHRILSTEGWSVVWLLHRCSFQCCYYPWVCVPRIDHVDSTRGSCSTTRDTSLCRRVLQLGFATPTENFILTILHTSSRSQLITTKAVIMTRTSLQFDKKIIKIQLSPQHHWPPKTLKKSTPL